MTKYFPPLFFRISINCCLVNESGKFKFDIFTALANDLTKIGDGHVKILAPAWKIINKVIMISPIRVSFNFIVDRALKPSANNRTTRHVKGA